MVARILLPPGWPQPRGYTEGMAATGTVVTIAGQVGWDSSHRLAGPGFVEQTRQALANIRDILAEAGGKPEDIVRLTWYVTSKDAYLADRQGLGEAYRAVMGRHYPPMAAVQVVALMVTGALVEIEATAVVAKDG